MPPPPNLEQLRQQLQFPGMPMPESDVFREWLERHAVEYDKIDFNVRLGDGVQLGEGFSDAVREQANLATQKRADVVVWLDGIPKIIEVKIRASLGAMGQLIGYRTLWERTYPNTAVPSLEVIARRIDDDAAYVLSANGINVTLYED